MGDRVSALTARIALLPTSPQGSRCLVWETGDTWAATGWQGPSTGHLGGVASMDATRDEIKLTPGAANQHGYVFWPVHAGRRFTLSFEVRVKRMSTLPGVKIWAAAWSPNLSHASSGSTLNKDLRLTMDAQVGTLTSETLTKSVLLDPAYTASEIWTPVVLEVTQGVEVVYVHGTATQRVASTLVTTSTVPCSSYVCIGAQTGSSSYSEVGVRNMITLHCMDPESLGRDVRRLTSNEVEFETYMLVRRSRPPRDAVAFQSDEYGPVWGGFCVTKEHGLMPCKIVSANNTQPVGIYTVGNPARCITSGVFFYIAPKSGYMACRRRSTGLPPPGAITGTYASSAAVRRPMHLIYCEYHNAFGRWEPGGVAEVQSHQQMMSMLDDGSWDYVCVVPQKTRHRWVQWARKCTMILGTNTPTGENPVGTHEFARLTEYADTNGYTGINYVYLMTPPFTFHPYTAASNATTLANSELQPVAAGNGYSLYIREDLIAKNIPPATVSCANYTAQTYFASSAPKLPWRWNDWAGWYAYTPFLRGRWYVFDQLADHAATNTYNDWLDPSNWGYGSVVQCMARAESTLDCAQFGYGPTLESGGKSGYCFMRKDVAAWPLKPWANSNTGIEAWSEQSQRTYIREEYVPVSERSKGQLVQWEQGRMKKWA